MEAWLHDTYNNRLQGGLILKHVSTHYIQNNA